jgi:hypothetical protein
MRSVGEGGRASAAEWERERERERDVEEKKGRKMKRAERNESADSTRRPLRKVYRALAFPMRPLSILCTNARLFQRGALTRDF